MNFQADQKETCHDDLHKILQDAHDEVKKQGMSQPNFSLTLDELRYIFETMGYSREQFDFLIEFLKNNQNDDAMFYFEDKK